MRPCIASGRAWPAGPAGKLEMKRLSDVHLYNEAIRAVAVLRQMYQRGTYRVIRDPEGVVSLWSIEGYEKDPFSMQFANKGRISGNIADMPPEFARAFIEYVRKTPKR